MYYWYDYETFGSSPRKDRPAQFAGVRTDADLNVIDDPLVLYCKPSPDYLPKPAACLIHGITPQDALARGLPEAEFARRIHAQLACPDTCSVAYNGMDFDHEVSRHLFYRTLIEPYGWHWRDGCTRWDVIDLVRAAYAFRPDGIAWPAREEGTISFRLEDLAAANGIGHESAHDALADVTATIGVARLVKQAQPGLFDYYLKLRDRKYVEEVLTEKCLYVSSLIGSGLGCTTLVAPLARRPDGGGIVVYDLRHDPEDFAEMSTEQMRELLFTRKDDFPEGLRRPPLYLIKPNACPFVVPPVGLTGEMQERLCLDLDEIHAHEEKLRSYVGFAERAADVYEREFADADPDVDFALYDGFMPDGDRVCLDGALRRDPRLAEAAFSPFTDPRLAELVFRYRARNYPDTLTPEERARWHAHCRARHLTPGTDGVAPLDRFDSSIANLRAQHGEDSAKLRVLDEAADYGAKLRVWLEDVQVPADPVFD